MLNKSNPLTYFIANIMCNIKQMPSWLWYWKLLSSSMLSFSLILQKVSLAFLVITGTQLLYCPVRKKKLCFHFSYVNHVYKPVISSAYPTSTAFFPACSVLCSLLSTPAPASLLYPAIFCGIISSVHFLFAWVVSGSWPLLGLFVSDVW